MSRIYEPLKKGLSMGRWEFVFKEERGWRWTCYDSDDRPISYSGEYFPTVEACKADAAHYGYSAGESERKAD